MKPYDYSILCPKVKALWDTELSSCQIAHELKVSKSIISKALKKLGLKPRYRRKREIPNAELPDPFDYTQPICVYIDINIGVTVRRFRSGIADGYRTQLSAR